MQVSFPLGQDPGRWMGSHSRSLSSQPMGGCSMDSGLWALPVCRSQVSTDRHFSTKASASVFFSSTLKWFWVLCTGKLDLVCLGTRYWSHCRHSWGCSGTQHCGLEAVWSSEVKIHMGVQTAVGCTASSCAEGLLISTVGAAVKH